MTLPKGVSRSAPPSRVKVNPDEFKSLLGYLGPYYNTENLDGRVSVLTNTVYVRPHETWQATGMIRNQTCQPVRVTALTARLLGSNDAPIEYVTATLPVSDLRPGEPAPFIIETTIPRTEVKSVDWHIDYTSVELAPPQRSFSFLLHQEREAPDGSGYTLLGSIRNLDTLLADNTHVTAAWTDADGRVIYVASPNIRLASDLSTLRAAVDLAGGDFEDFIFTTNDPSLIPLLIQAKISLWGVSN